ncbi:MAG: RsmE family RNA methyltransferase [Calditrichota bacterium]
MDSFYCPELTVTTQTITLPDSEMKHAIQVKRLRTGDTVQLVNGMGISAHAVITEISRRECLLQIESVHESSPPLAHALTIAISTIRPNRMDYTVEKLCEVGVKEIQFLHMKNTSIHTFKKSHLQKIAVSAMKQSKQAWLTTLHEPVLLNNWLTSLSNDSTKLIAHTDSSEENSINIESSSIDLLIGPEGGFSDEEYRFAIEHRFQPITLGDTILRAETAAVVGAAKVLSLI